MSYKETVMKFVFYFLKHAAAAEEEEEELPRIVNIVIFVILFH